MRAKRGSEDEEAPDRPEESRKLDGIRLFGVAPEVIRPWLPVYPPDESLFFGIDPKDVRAFLDEQAAMAKRVDAAVEAEVARKAARAGQAAQHPLDLPELRNMSQDAMVAALADAPELMAPILSAVVRAFVIAGLRAPAAHTHDGWQAVLQAVRVVLGTALHDAIREARLPDGETRPAMPIRVWALAYAAVRAHMVARFREPEAATPEGRSRIKNEVLTLVWDAILDAVKQAPRPSPQLPRARSRPGSPPAVR